VPRHLNLIFAPLVLAAMALPSCVHVRVTSKNLLSPDEPPASARLAAGYAIEDMAIQRADRVVGITRAHRDGNQIVVIFCGGDGFHRSTEGGSVLTALAQNVDVVLFDYPGYGASTGKADPESILDNARATADFVSQLPSTGGQKRVLYGFSLGGVVAAQLAGEQPVDGLILEATAPNVGSWARTRVPWFARPFVRVELDAALARIDNVKALKNFRGSVLILAGEHDRRAPPVLSRDMAKRLSAEGVRTELHVFEGASHGEIYKAAAFRPTLDRFLAGL
jgi:pimeloyl-ACP methyl ester carboxylesterase